MDQNTELDFFQQALKAFDAPMPPLEETQEAVAAEPVSALPETIEEEKKPRRKWPAILGVCFAALLLAVILVLDFGTAELIVTNRDVEENQFYGVDSEGTGYYVVWPRTEEVSKGSRVKVSYFCLREKLMPDPYFTSSIMLWNKVWAWRVQTQPYEPSVNVTTTTRPPKDPEYTLTVSIFRDPLTALAVSRPTEVSVKFSLSQEDAEALLIDIEALEWQSTLLPEDYFDSVPEEPAATFPVFNPEDFMDDLLIIDTKQTVFVPVGKFVLQSDEPLYRDAYFSADGRFKSQDAMAEDKALLYAILAHLADATKETTPSYELYVNQENNSHYIGFGDDGASMYYMSDLTSFSSVLSPYGLVQLDYAIAEDILLMWPKDGKTDLYGFLIDEDSLTYSAKHSYTTGTKIEDGTVYRRVLDIVETQPQPVLGDTILFELPQYDAETVSYDLDPDTASKLQQLLDDMAWESVPPGMDTKRICQISLSLSEDKTVIGFGEDGYLYRGITKAPIPSDAWELLMELMFKAGQPVVPGCYCYAAVSEQAVYDLNLLSDGTYWLWRDSICLSFGRYAMVGDMIFLHNGANACYLTKTMDGWQIKTSTIEAFRWIPSDAAFNYNGDIRDREENAVPELPADGTKTVLVRVQLPNVDAESEWKEIYGSQIKNINTLLQSQRWEPVPAAAYLPQDYLSFQMAVEDDYEIVSFETVKLSPDGYLYYNTVRAKLNDTDWSTFMDRVRFVSGTPRLFADYQMQERLYELILGGSGYDIYLVRSASDSGQFAIIGDVLYLDSSDGGVCYLKWSEGNLECLYSVDFVTAFTEGEIFVPNQSDPEDSEDLNNEIPACDEEE